MYHIYRPHIFVQLPYYLHLYTLAASHLRQKATEFTTCIQFWILPALVCPYCQRNVSKRVSDSFVRAKCPDSFIGKMPTTPQVVYCILPVEGFSLFRQGDHIKRGCNWTRLLCTTHRFLRKEDKSMPIDRLGFVVLLDTNIKTKVRHEHHWKGVVH